MSERNPPPAGQGPARNLPLKVFRVDPGQTVTVRMLSKSYGGLFTHWARGRSHYCNPDGCDGTLHKTERFWKGYAAADIWNRQRALWFPVVLEITEHTELDLRQVYKRGQVWELERPAQAKSKKGPVRAWLIESRDPAQVPPAHEIVPVLRHLYHVDCIDLESSNPMPDRVYVEPSADPGPAARHDGDKPLSPEERKAVWEQVRKGMHANGKAPQGA